MVNLLIFQSSNDSDIVQSAIIFTITIVVVVAIVLHSR